ncbi:CDK2-associated and cullin domain-containing protein 1 isoform X1 [Falco biarmicus]|uniref:CDK2-associated and cullin domain-containing protein 1 isoform X1 n=1 Tax=Falco rusticolus TaxID=120794 RepID=UPI0018869902|nr:CDK2-associated and cullin domain-containing protein 1 isoform X1 [Falco rusticolus]XP_055576240.1 CDK2-associated and cullin domain-containing protein 1 isoform X1 [Falco cherrug]XP_055659442.1 CDK2-associated and cullin domain-containing protein 1 isoform X1 [Falco peregrinus]XP_056207616.1 CDK2-associated and cullin domain-containing protein 1 isoform X1 [Falco biarmicus]
MEEESMEEEGGCEAMMDDQNHNNWGAGGYGRHLLGPAAAPLGDRLLRGVSAEPPAGPEFPAVSEANGVLRGCEPGAAAAAKGGAGAIAAAININASTSKFLMNVITIEDYKSTYWPKLDSAIDQLLTQSPGDYIPISYEQIYSCVYKCVCQQHSEQMYSDLIKKITNHLERVSKELQASPPDLYIERFNIALGQYMGALQSIVPLFIYMNKFYIETKLNRDLKDDLIKLFTEHVAEKHIYNLMPSCHSIRAWKLALLFEAVFRKDCKYISALLLEAQSTPFQITPSTMANIVKGLYTLRPEWVQMAPALFSKFIPNILPPAVESELQEYAAQDQKLQRELMQNGFTRGDQSRKRAGEELTYNGSSACASSRGYR